MRIAVVPFNAAEGTSPALGRQFATFAAEQLKAYADAEIDVINFMTQVDTPQGPRSVFVNLESGFFEREQLDSLFQEAPIDLIQEGLLNQNGEEFELTVRYHERHATEPKLTRLFTFSKNEIFTTLQSLIKLLADNAKIGLPEVLAGEAIEFGTEDADVFLKFLEGHDALHYLQQANGSVTPDFDPEPAISGLLEAIKADPDFEGPYHVLVQLSRACVAFRVGSFELIEKSLLTAAEIVPEDFGAYFALSELYPAINNWSKSADMLEKAIKLSPEDPALYTRLGIAQMNTGMPMNAEKNFKKALDMEGDDKPSMDYLASALAQSNRGHEVPALWKQMLEKHPTSGTFFAKYGLALLQTGDEPGAKAAFERALTEAEDPIIVKRFYAPMLGRAGEIDRAMDFYEDCLDHSPNDIDVLLEYAGVLQQAERDFEIPKVLKDVLNSNPDPNVRAQTLAWLLEIEQPKRVESVESARAKMEASDFEGAIRELKPLRNWMADYWKMWALLSSAYNRTEQFQEAQESAQRLLELFPGCEPAYGELVAALTGQDRMEEAYNVMRAAAQQMPNSVPVHVNLALAAKRAGHSDEARALAKQLREALGSNPELENVLTEIES